jgi:hypothetical protein
MPSYDVPTEYSGLLIQADDKLHPMFQAIARDALKAIASKPVGRRLLMDIDQTPLPPRSRFKIRICCPAVIRAAPGDVVDATPGSKAVRGNELAAVAGTGRNRGPGAGTAIRWNPNNINTPDGSRPSFIGLAHELIHARRNLLGIASASTREEEEYTVGFRYNGDGINENAIRAEHGVPLRATYTSAEGVFQSEIARDFGWLAPMIG